MIRRVLDASLGAKLLQREEYVTARLVNRIRRGDGCFSRSVEATLNLVRAAGDSDRKRTRSRLNRDG